MVAARSTVPVELVEVPSRRFAGATEAAAYYVIVEAIANAQKYAQASSMRVRCAVVRDVIEVEVVDDGIGGAIGEPSARGSRGFATGSRRSEAGSRSTARPAAERASPRRFRRPPASDEAVQKASARPALEADRAELGVQAARLGESPEADRDVPATFLRHVDRRVLTQMGQPVGAIGSVSKPTECARRTASRRDWAPSCERSARTWLRTVSIDTPISSAICVVVNPRPSN